MVVSTERGNEMTRAQKTNAILARSKKVRAHREFARSGGVIGAVIRFFVS